MDTTNPTDPNAPAAPVTDPTPAPAPTPDPAPAPTPPTFDQLIAAVNTITSTLDADTLAADKLTSDYNAAVKAANDKVSADKASLADATSKRDSAITASGVVVVQANGDGSFNIYEPVVGGGVVVKQGVSSTLALSAVAPSNPGPPAAQ